MHHIPITPQLCLYPIYHTFLLYPSPTPITVTAPPQQLHAQHRCNADNENQVTRYGDQGEGNYCKVGTTTLLLIVNMLLSPFLQLDHKTKPYAKFCSTMIFKNNLLKTVGKPGYKGKLQHDLK